MSILSRRAWATTVDRYDVLPAALTAVSLTLTFLIFHFFAVPYAMQVGFDEGYEAAGVERIIDGRWLPYVDAVAHRGPFLYWTQAIAHLMAGRFSWSGTRLLGLAAALTTVASTFLAGWAARWPVAGAIGAATYVYVVAVFYAPGGGVGVHGEPVAIAYASTGLFILCLALYRTTRPWMRVALVVVAGAFVGVAGLTKQTVAVACAPLLLMVLARGVSVETGRTSGEAPFPWRAIAARWLSPFVAGGAAVIALVLIRYALAGELATMIFWSTTFNAQVYMAPYKGQVTRLLIEWFLGEPWAILGALLAWFVAVGRPLASVRQLTGRAVIAGLDAAAFETGVGLTALLILLSAAIPHRIWPHYFVPVYPFFGLTLGLAVERQLRRGRSVPLVPQAATVLALGLVLISTGTGKLRELRQQRSAGALPSPLPEPACSEIDRIAGLGRDPIFIWGMAGDLYVTCRRRSSSMFTYTTVLAGIMPPFWAPDPTRVAPGSRETLIRELTSRPPPVIIDHPISPGAAMVDFPTVAAVLERYCRLPDVVDRKGRTLAFYARRDLSACAPSGTR